MTKRLCFISLALLSLLFSCKQEEPLSTVADLEYTKTIHYKVKVNGSVSTRASLNEHTQYVFEANDRLFVSHIESGNTVLYGVLSLMSGAGSTTAIFEGDLACLEEFDVQSSTPINVVLVSSQDRLHSFAEGKITGTTYPDDEFASTLAEAVQKFSHFTCSTTFGNTRFTLSQQSAFLIFSVDFKVSTVPVSTPVTVKVFNNNDAVTPIREAEVSATDSGSGKSRVDFVFAFPGGSTSLTDAELSVVWGNGENDHKEFDIDDKSLAVNNYYTVPRTTIELVNAFHIRARDAGTTNVTFNYTYDTGGIQYMSDDLGVYDWTHYDGSQLSLSQDDVVYFKGTRSDYDCIGTKQLFTADQVCYIGGIITSLLADDTQYAPYAFRSAFSNGTCVDAVTNPAAVTWVDIDPGDPLILPSFTSQECYREMFRNCTSLTTGPDLPAETVAPGCYWNMFRKCTELTTVSSVLPATTLAENCYRELFRECSKVTTVPALPAPTLAPSCYRQMFANCSKLSSVTCLATDISATDSHLNWMTSANNKNTCIFYKASTMTVGNGGWSRDNSGILSNWQVVDYVEPTP